MARKNNAEFQLFENQSLGANFNAPITDVRFQDIATIVIETSNVSANTGTFTLQYRLTSREGDQPSKKSSWLNYPTLTTTLTGSNDQITYRLLDIGESEIRLNFVSGGADGTATAYVNARQKGG